MIACSGDSALLSGIKRTKRDLGKHGRTDQPARRLSLPSGTYRRSPTEGPPPKTRWISLELPPSSLMGKMWVVRKLWENAPSIAFAPVPPPMTEKTCISSGRASLVARVGVEVCEAAAERGWRGEGARTVGKAGTRSKYGGSILRQSRREMGLGKGWSERERRTAFELSLRDLFLSALVSLGTYLSPSIAFRHLPTEPCLLPLRLPSPSSLSELVASVLLPSCRSSTALIAVTSTSLPSWTARTCWERLLVMLLPSTTTRSCVRTTPIREFRAPPPKVSVEADSRAPCSLLASTPSSPRSP